METFRRIERSITDFCQVNYGRNPAIWPVSAFELATIRTELKAETGQAHDKEVFIKGTLLRVPEYPF